MADKCCYSNDGMTFRWVPEEYQAEIGEVLSDTPLSPEERTAAFPGFAKAMADQEIRNQIITLELSVTPRRIREAIACTDDGWLDNLNAQIVKLRSQL